MKRTSPPISGMFTNASDGSDPSQAAYGVIEFSREHATITFHPPTAALGSRDNFPKTLHLLKDGDVIAVILDCFVLQGGAGLVHTVAVRRALIFHHAMDEATPSEFTEVAVQIDGLREWIGFGIPQNDTAPQKVTLSTKVGDLDCKVFMGVSTGGTMFDERRRISGSLSLFSATPREIDYWIDQVNWFSHLISVFAESACVYTDVSLETATESASLWVPTIEVADNISRHPRMWPFTLLDADFPEGERIIERWFAVRPRVQVLTGMFLEEWFHPAQILESKFISLMQGLEAYCRHAFAGKDLFLPPEEYGKLHKLVTTAIPSGTDPAIKESLKARLKYGNEHSLRKRIANLLLAHPDATDAMMDLFDVPQKIWVKQTVDKRNAITHPSPDAEEFARQRKGLFETLQEVRVLCQYLLLYETLGGSDAALRVLTKTRVYKEVEFRKSLKRASKAGGSPPDRGA